MPSTALPNFVGGSYQSAALNVDAEECINLYVENQEVPGAKAPVVLFGSPGLRQWLEVETGPIRGMLDVENFLYVVSGSNVYKIAPDFTPTFLGNVANDTQPVQMVANANWILITSANIAYYTAVSTSFSPITPVASPPWTSAIDCAFNNGYFIVLDNNGTPFGGQFFISALNDATSWDPLDFSTSPSSNNKLRALAVTHNELWVFGTVVTQPFYYNPASTNFPFIANQQVLVEQGIESTNTRAAMDNSLFWLGRSSYGILQAFTANGYLPQRISTYPVEQEWATYTQPNNSVGWVFQMNGHLFYQLNFLGDNKSWRYDHSTNLWHRVAYRNPMTGADECHLGNNHVIHNGLHLVGSRRDTFIYSMSSQYYDDDGDPLVALRRAPFPFQGGKRVFFPVFELITTPGAGNGVPNTPEFNPAWMFRWSNDGGHRWSPEFQLQLGEQGQYFHRQRKINCGSGRNRVFEVSISAAVQRCIIGAELPEGVTVGGA